MTSPRSRFLSRSLAVLALLVGALVVSAAAPGVSETSAIVHRDSDGTTTFSLDGGHVLITTGAVGTLSLSSCTAGRFCVWSESGYTGTLWQYTVTGDYIDLPYAGPGSYWNRRTRTAWLVEFADGYGRQYCIPPDGRNTAAGGWLGTAGSTWLSASATSC